MKGIIFTTFLEMVEERYSLQIADEMISRANVSSGGSYTSVGTYNHGEMLSLVNELANQTLIPKRELVCSFGEHLFSQLTQLYPEFIDSDRCMFEFLPMVDSYIHVEVRKLYPEAELPRFYFERKDEDTLIMLYQSNRPFADLAEGLLGGCIRYFGEDIELNREDLGRQDGLTARFTLTKRGHSV